ncbi:hypothetical protein AB0F39_34505 [Streptomyces murinus]|uniref:hypothetical protein n=1 Tax=Streptomyces murinus TaxID=33900 RepID=UPI00340CB79C
MTTITTRLGTTLAAAGIALCGITAAPAEAAPHPRACNTQGAAEALHTTAAVHLRTGKGARTRSRAVLPKNTDVYAECWGTTGTGDWWAYVEVESGRYAGFPHGLHGWVVGDYLGTGYRHGG